METNNADGFFSAAYKIITYVLIVFWCFFGLCFFYEYYSKKVLYPLGYKEETLDCAREYDLDPALVFAIIRVESGFDCNAQSGKGATGLMQITAETGNYIAGKLKIINYNLLDAKTNIRFGCFYVRYLTDGFSDAKTAIAAYNAGEGNVRIWLENKAYSEDGKTLKEIPFKETRVYVKKIYESFRKYKKLYGKLLDKSVKNE